MNKFSFLALAALLLLLASCRNPYSGGTMLFVRAEGADLPVYVKGNVDSGTALMVIHGGPGGDSMIYASVPAFKAIEERYAVVYWDQRSSGSAQGNAADGTLTMEQFVADTGSVLDAVRSLYGFSSVFVLGHSWGGCLGTAFLLSPGQQEKVAGWIEVDGGHNLREGMRLSRDFVIAYASAQGGSYWEKALSWYETNPVITSANVIKHSGYVSKAKGYSYSGESDVDMLPYIFFSPATFPGNALAQLRPTEALGQIWEESLSGGMGAITVPSLVLWGRHDGIIPAPLAQDAYDSLGAPPEDKSVVYFENSGHSPMIEEGEAFSAAVLAFMDSYR